MPSDNGTFFIIFLMLQDQPFEKNLHTKNKQLSNRSQNSESLQSVLSSAEASSILTYIKLQQHLNPKIQKNNQIYAIILIIHQIAMCFLYGFLFSFPERSLKAVDIQQKSIHGTFIVLLLMLLVVLGFGLLFSYYKHMTWSGIGFAFLIMVLTFQWFFLFNNFISRFSMTTPSRNFSTPIEKNWIYLWNGDLIRTFQSYQTEIDYWTFGGTITEAIKCSLANLVMFSAIMGRAGFLQLYVITMLGTFGYELNRFVISLLGIDFGSSHAIFTYSGFMGLSLGFMLFLRKNRNQDKGLTTKHQLYTSTPKNAYLSLVGLLIIFSLFPILTLDPETPSETSFSVQYLRYQIVNSALSIYSSMTVAASTAIGLCVFFYEKIDIKSLINCTIAGGIVTLSSCFYLKQQWASFLLGMIAAVVQFIIQHAYQKKKSKIFNTYLLGFFGLHGVISGIFEAIFQVVYNPPDNEIQGNNIFVCAVSVGIGLTFGVITGIAISFLNKNEKMDYFNDIPYWTDHHQQMLYDRETQKAIEKANIQKISKIKSSGLIAYI